MKTPDYARKNSLPPLQPKQLKRAWDRAVRINAIYSAFPASSFFRSLVYALVSLRWRTPNLVRRSEAPLNIAALSDEEIIMESSGHNRDCYHRNTELEASTTKARIQNQFELSGRVRRRKSEAHEQTQDRRAVGRTAI